MKTIMVLIVIIILAFSGSLQASNAGLEGPAPNSGDGISDGSGLDPSPNGPSNDTNDISPPGPAPNSGDGVPDGSGF